MDLFSLLGRNNQQQQQQQQQSTLPENNPGTNPVNPSMQGNGQPNPNQQQLQQQQNAENSAVDSAQNQQISPMDMLNNLFNNDNENTNNQPSEGNDVNIFDLDNLEDFQKLVSQQQFVQQDQAELMQQALGGDVGALQQLLNSVGQRTFMESSKLNAAMGNRLAASILEKVNSQLPKQLREYSTQTATVSSNELYQNKAVRPVIDMMRSKFMARYPEATPAEVAEAVNKAFTTFVSEANSALNPGQPGPTDRRNAGTVQEQDFSDFWGN